MRDFKLCVEYHSLIKRILSLNTKGKLVFFYGGFPPKLAADFMCLANPLNTPNKEYRSK
jgi:hypothetical protein